MKRSDGRHVNNPSVKEFHARVETQHAGFRHAVILLYIEAMLYQSRHGLIVAFHFGICNPTLATTCCTSLSPRPERFTMMSESLLILGARTMHSATACALSSAGMMPSSRASFINASSALSSVAYVYSTRFWSYNHACSGPTA